MKTLLSMLFSLTMIICMSQSITGGWKGKTNDENGKEVIIAVIFSSNHQVATWYDAKNGEFIKTNGGLWELNGNTMTETVEFDTEKSDRVGSSVTFEISIEKNQMKIVDSDMILTKIDDGSESDLAGAWLITGRKRDGVLKESIPGSRKTMKILSGTLFQWIAYNTETGEFFGTGGGNYSTKDGKYTENIEFFSRDNSRVGASLEFNYELKDGKWHHSGKSSKGDSIYEVWSLRPL